MHIGQVYRYLLNNNWPEVQYILTGPDLSISIPFLMGGLVASCLVHSTPDQAVQVRALAGDIVLCS